MTTPQQSEGDRSRDEVLAGEYVLGVLSLDARRQVEERIERDGDFAAIVARWQRNLESFDDEYQPQAPPDHLFPAIEQRLFPAASTGGRRAGHLWNSLLLWRAISFASIALLVTYVSLQSGWIGGGPAAEPLVAEMAGEGNSVALMAHYDSSSGRLRVTPVAAGPAEERSLELWLVPGGSDPAISLGVLPQSGEGELEIPQEIRSRMDEGITLAVSLEPFGGSPTGRATGPVIAAGQARRP